jgi:hypothetical protein
MDPDEALVSFYNSSYGGRYELAGDVLGRDILAEEGWVTYSQCRRDPLSTHGASSCKVILNRITDAGIAEAKVLIKEKEEDAVAFLNSLEELPPRVKDFYRYLVKKWLIACENRMLYRWELRNEDSKRFIRFTLPSSVQETVNQLNETLVKNNLASYGSLSHLTRGPSRTTLVTCPELSQIFFEGRGWREPYAKGVKHVELDEYLRYLLNGISLARAKYHLLEFFSSNRNGLGESTFRWLSSEYGVSVGSLMKFLDHLVDSDYVRKLSDEEKERERVFVRGDPIRYYWGVRDSLNEYELEVNENVEKWFETGETVFQRFDFKKAYQ